MNSSVIHELNFRNLLSMTLEILQTSQKQNCCTRVSTHDTRVIFSQDSESLLPRHSVPSLRRCPGHKNQYFVPLKYFILHIGKEIVSCENAPPILINGAQTLYVFIWNLLINISKQRTVYLLQAVLKINTKLLAAKMGRRTFKKILIAVVLKRRQTRPKLYRDREENNIVIRTKVDITITVCQMINY